jgi:hypothetical protein
MQIINIQLNIVHKIIAEIWVNYVLRNIHGVTMTQEGTSQMS